MLKGAFIFVKSTVVIDCQRYLCVRSNPYEGGVSHDQRYSNTNTSLPPPQSACQCTGISLQPQPTISPRSHFCPNWSLKSYRLLVTTVVIINLSDIDNSPRIRDIKKVIGCIFVIFFPILCFYLVPGSRTPVPKEMIDWWTVGLRYRNVQLHIFNLTIWNSL